MTIEQFLCDENVEKILIEKLNILNQDIYLNEKKIDVNLRISIFYYGVSSTSQKPILLKDYIKKWLYEVKSNELKPTSFDRKEQTINYQIIPYIGEIPLNKLSSDDVQNMINELKSKYSYSTVKKAYEALNACLKYAVKKKELLYNPADCVSLPKNMEQATSKIKYFNDEQIAKIIRESIRCYKTGHRVYRMGEIILFLLNTGMRIGEALALKWSDIDFQKHNVKVRKNVVFVKKRDNAKSKNYEYKEQSTKTKSGSRIVPLNSDAMKALINIKVVNGQYEYVFSTSKGNRLYPRNVDRMFRSILKNCDIELTGVHTLRHTFASRLFAKGIDVKTVSELLGHSEVGITYDTYIHLIQEQHIAAVETLENVLL